MGWRAAVVRLPGCVVEEIDGFRNRSEVIRAAARLLLERAGRRRPCLTEA